MDMDSVMADTFNNLYLQEKSAISLEQFDPEYVLQLASQTSSRYGGATLLAATSSNYSVRLYARYNLANVGMIKGHDDVISCVRFSQQDRNIYTSSHDGTVKSWDLRTDTRRPSIVFQGYQKTKNVFTAFDISCSDKFLCCGTEGNSQGDSNLIFWDTRNWKPLGVYSECHQKDVTQVQFHPYEPDKLITSGVDGLVNVFDIGKNGEDEALLTSLNAECSVNRIGWCGLENEQVYCLTSIETLHIWETETEEFETIAELADVRDTYKDANIDYMVDCFQTNYSDLPMVLFGDKHGKLHVAALDGSTLKHQATLGYAHTETVRCLDYDTETGTLVTGGEDAMLCLWSPQHAEVRTGRGKTLLKAPSQMKTRRNDCSRRF